MQRCVCINFAVTLKLKSVGPRPEKNASVRVSEQRDAAQSVRLWYQASEVSEDNGRRDERAGGTSLNGSFIAFQNVYWRYWVTAAPFSSTGWNPGKCSILVKHGYL